MSTTNNGHELITELQNVKNKIAGANNLDPEARDLLYKELRDGMLSIETEMDMKTRILFEMMETVACDIAMDMGLFKALNQSQGQATAAELASECKAEANLVERILRILSAYGAVAASRGNGTPVYGPSIVTRHFATRPGIAGMRFLHEFLAPGWVHLRRKLKENNYRSLTSPLDTAFTDAYNKPGQPLWNILVSTPYAEDGGITMATFYDSRKEWTDLYPAEERLIKDAKTDADAVLMVDIGGYTGSQTIEFKQRFPHAPGRMIVEDLPPVVAQQASPPQGIEFLAQDFFEPQQVRGARFYYMRYISHDWSDPNLIKILSHIRDVMTPGYSKLIINDFIMPEFGANMLQTAQDLNMMSLGGGEERTARRHREYIEAAGLKVCGMWSADDGISTGVIEAELP